MFDQESALGFFSLGTVVNTTGGDTIEVCALEKTPLVNGMLKKNIETIKVNDMPDALGIKRSGSSTVKDTVTAEWLPLGDSNRVTAPNVEAGERVMIFRLADTEKYYWMTIRNDYSIRRGESVKWRFGNMTRKEDKLKPATDNNSHWFEFNGIGGAITLHTSKNKGEAVIFDMAFDLRKGTWALMDDRRNYIKTNNAKDAIEINFCKKITLKDLRGNFIVVDSLKDTITITANKKIVLDVPQAETTKDLEVKGNLKVNGSLGVNGGISVGGSVKSKGPMYAPAFIRT